jgi:hypothetical protein
MERKAGNRGDEWLEAQRRCRLSTEEVRMAKELGFEPHSLIKNIPAKSQPWKAPGRNVRVGRRDRALGIGARIGNGTDEPVCLGHEALSRTEPAVFQAEAELAANLLKLVELQNQVVDLVPKVVVAEGLLRLDPVTDGAGNPPEPSAREWTSHRVSFLKESQGAPAFVSAGAP